MFLPLFVAVILRQFQDETSAENFVLNPTRLAEFRKIWQKFDRYLFILFIYFILFIKYIWFDFTEIWKTKDTRF
jgi:hypothetical protein